MVVRTGRRRWVAAVGVLSLAACEEQMPTGVRDDIAAAPITIEVELPWSVFGSDLEAFGGYGTIADIGRGVLATDYEGSLNARTLVRFGAYPDRATVRDTTGTARTDSTLTYIGGRMVAFFDSAASTNTGPVEIQLGATQQVWDSETASWAFAVDSAGDQQAWGTAGGGPVLDLVSATWDPASGDSVFFPLDSAAVANWEDTADLSRGAHLRVVTDSVRLRVRRAELRLDARSSVNPDTIVALTAPTNRLTFVYDPAPAPPPDGIRIGGAPAWRTVLDIELPEELTGPPEFCAVVSCPHPLQAGEISFAALVVTSRTTEAAFAPSDSVGLDVRPVLQRAALPKAPLGTSLIGTVLGRLVGPNAFGSQPGQEIEIPITAFARALLEEPEPGEIPPPNALALLAAVEPISITFASFEGPGGPGEPRLRLVLTIGPAVELP